MEPQVIDTIQDRVNVSAASGTWARSSDRGDQEYVIFASDYSFDTTTSFMNGAFITFKNLLGSYVMDDGKRVEETSYIVNRADFDRLAQLIENQESVLVLSNVKYDDTRNAKLVFMDGRPDVELGVFKPVTEAYAKAQDNWTYDPYLDQYFVAGA